MIDPHGVSRTADRSRTIRQSTVNAADTCLHRLNWAFTEQTGHTPNTLFGTAIHWAIANFYYAHQVDPDVDVSVADIVRLGLDKWDEHADSVSWVDEPVSAAEFRERIGPALDFYVHRVAWPVSARDPMKVLAVEEEWWWPLDDGWVVKGEVDLVLVHEDRQDWQVIVDHKTANRAWPKDKHLSQKTAQPAIYCTFWPMAWAEQHQVDRPQVDMVFDIMWELKAGWQHERRWATPTAQDALRVLEKVRLLCQLVDSGSPLFPNTGSQLCNERWCSWWHRCAFGGGPIDGQLVDIRNRKESNAH